MTEAVKIDDGGPAFPCTNEQFTHGNPKVGDAWSGLSLRDHFAGLALGGAWSASGDQSLKVNEGQTYEGALLEYWSGIAKAAYIAADAMIAARKAGA